MRESKLEAMLKREVEARGGRCIKWTSPGRRALLDRICLFPHARIVFVEVKKPNKEPESAQLREIDRLRALGFKACWISNEEDLMYLCAWFPAPISKP
jgi:hypothetical protein